MPIAMVLGGTSSHIPLLEELKVRGYHTVLVDYLPEPPAKPYADEHLVVSTLDAGKVEEEARRLGADLVIDGCLDQPLAVACLVSERLGLTAPLSYKGALDVTDKVRMKAVMTANMIPTAPYVVVSKGDTPPHALSYPLMVKPCDGTGSLGVGRAVDADGLDRCLENAFQASRSGQVIIEEFREGPEWNIYAFVANGVPRLLMVLKKFKAHGGYDHGMQQIGSVASIVVEEDLKRKLNDLLERTVRAFAIKNGPLLIQAIVNGLEFSVIEVAARIGGSGLSSWMLKDTTGLDVYAATVDAWLGRVVEPPAIASSELVASNFIYAAPGVFGSVTGLEELVERKVIGTFLTYKTKGMVVPVDFSSKNRVAAFVVKGADHNELRERIRIAVNGSDVLDVNGGSLKIEGMFLGSGEQELS